MSFSFNNPTLRCAAGAVMLVALSPVTAAHAQSNGGGMTMAGGKHSHKPSKGDANQPAPTEHQPQPSQKLKDEPNQVKEQVAPIPDAPVKPGSTPAPGQDTPKPQH